MSLSLDMIREANAFLDPHIRRTPVEFSPLLSEHLGVDVWLKLENLQITGSFKLRGALYAMHRLMEQGINRVATCSAGNHGRGLAHAAQVLGADVTVFVPSVVDPVKVAGMKRNGADIRLSPFPGFDDTEAWAIETAETEGIPYISAYDDATVMAGNGGTVAIEVESQVPDAGTFVMPVGGGGHAAGFAFWMCERRPSARIIACQHEGSPALARSLELGEAVRRMEPIDTLASGLEGGLGVAPFDILRSRVDDVCLVSESALRSAMRWMVDNHQIIMEGSCAVAVAACLDPAFPKPTSPVVIFISGRNIARPTLLDVLAEG